MYNLILLFSVWLLTHLFSGLRYLSVFYLGLTHVIGWRAFENGAIHLWMHSVGAQDPGSINPPLSVEEKKEPGSSLKGREWSQLNFLVSEQRSS